MTDETKTPSDYTLSWQECKNHIATTPDYDRILRKSYVDCLTPPEGPMCIVGDAALICADKRPMDSSNVCFNRPLIEGTCDIPPGEALNYVVTTSTYWRVLREWYARRCQ